MVNTEQDTINLKVLVDSYTSNVTRLDKELIQLRRNADELAEEVAADKEQRESVQSRTETLERQRASRLSELEELRFAFGNAQLDNNVGEEQKLRRRKQIIDFEIAEIEQGIRGCVVSANDFGERAASLQVQKDELETRLPKKSYEQALNNPLLQTVANTLRGDADRLRKLWNGIKVPAASKDAVEEARRQRGVKATADPAWLVEQERKRQERLRRFENVQGSTDAMHEAMTRTYREPEPSVKATTDADGRLSGDAVRAALAAKGA